MFKITINIKNIILYTIYLSKITLQKTNPNLVVNINEKVINIFLIRTIKKIKFDAFFLIHSRFYLNLI
jgi:hypothetical protein